MILTRIFGRKRKLMEAIMQPQAQTISPTQELAEKLQALDGERQGLGVSRAVKEASVKTLQKMREETLALLIDSPSQERRTIHEEIETLEANIREELRVVEALDVEIQRLEVGIAAIHKDLAAVREQIQLGEKAAQFAAKKSELVADVARALNALDYARRCLASLDVHAYELGEAFGQPGQSAAESSWNDFFEVQRNLQNVGWRRAFPSSRLQLEIRLLPMFGPGESAPVEKP